MTFVCKYVALHVPDLRAAEDFYGSTFGMELLFRESEGDLDTWHTLRPELDWDAARARGVDVDMVALARNGFVLALFRGPPAPGAVYEICVGVEPDELDELQARASGQTGVVESRSGFLRLDDPFGFRWVFRPADARFRSSGEISGHWLP